MNTHLRLNPLTNTCTRHRQNGPIILKLLEDVREERQRKIERIRGKQTEQDSEEV